MMALNSITNMRATLFALKRSTALTVSSSQPLLVLKQDMDKTEDHGKWLMHSPHWHLIILDARHSSQENLQASSKSSMKMAAIHLATKGLMPAQWVTHNLCHPVI